MRLLIAGAVLFVSLLSACGGPATSTAHSSPAASARPSATPTVAPQASASEACRLYQSGIQASSQSHDWSLMERDLSQARNEAETAQRGDSRYQPLHTHLAALLQAVMSYDAAGVTAAGRLVQNDCATLPS